VEQPASTGSPSIFLTDASAADFYSPQNRPASRAPTNVIPNCAAMAGMFAPSDALATCSIKLSNPLGAVETSVRPPFGPERKAWGISIGAS